MGTCIILPLLSGGAPVSDIPPNCCPIMFICIAIPCRFMFWKCSIWLFTILFIDAWLFRRLYCEVIGRWLLPYMASWLAFLPFCGLLTEFLIILFICILLRTEGGDWLFCMLWILRCC